MSLQLGNKLGGINYNLGRGLRFQGSPGFHELANGLDETDKLPLLSPASTGLGLVTKYSRMTSESRN